MEYSIILEKVEGQPASDLLALGSDSCTYMLMELNLGASKDQNDGKSSWLYIGPIILARQDDGAYVEPGWFSVILIRLKLLDPSL